MFGIWNNNRQKRK